MVLERLKTGLGKRKVQVFLVFLFFSALSWFVSNLSKKYTSVTSFPLRYTNVPSDLRLVVPPSREIGVKLNAVGFQFLGFTFRKQAVSLDVSKVAKKNGRFFIAPKTYRRQIEKQLVSGITIVEMDNDTLYPELREMAKKELPVVLDVSYTLKSNYALRGTFEAKPKRVTLYGPESEIDTVTSIRTKSMDLGVLDASVDTNLDLILPEEMEFSYLKDKSVTLKASVFKFSERILQVPVTPVNLPKGTRIKTFPEMVALRCQGEIQDLKALEAADFLVVVDYGQVGETEGNTLKLTLRAYPELLNAVEIMEEDVEFILRQE